MLKRRKFKKELYKFLEIIKFLRVMIISIVKDLNVLVIIICWFKEFIIRKRFNDI